MNEQKLYDVRFFQDKDGKEPIRDFLVDLKQKGVTSKTARINAEKILAYIRALEEFGTRAGQPYIKHIDGELWELRPLRNRIFFFYWQEDTVVLLHHFIKKTQKTPRKEIDQAQRNLQEFQERGKQNEKSK